MRPQRVQKKTWCKSSPYMEHHHEEFKAGSTTCRINGGLSLWFLWANSTCFISVSLKGWSEQKWAELLYEEPHGDLGLIKTLPWIFLSYIYGIYAFVMKQWKKRREGNGKQTSTQTQVFWSAFVLYVYPTWDFKINKKKKKNSIAVTHSRNISGKYTLKG